MYVCVLASKAGFDGACRVLFCRCLWRDKLGCLDLPCLSSLLRRALTAQLALAAVMEKSKPEALLLSSLVAALVGFF